VHGDDVLVVAVVVVRASLELALYELNDAHAAAQSHKDLGRCDGMFAHVVMRTWKKMARLGPRSEHIVETMPRKLSW
jgi:hypothetical protein